jgi:hypothetical protein
VSLVYEKEPISFREKLCGLRVGSPTCVTGSAALLKASLSDHMSRSEIAPIP